MSKRQKKKEQKCISSRGILDTPFELVYNLDGSTISWKVFIFAKRLLAHLVDIRPI